MSSNDVSPMWVDAFVQTLQRCAISSSESVVVLSERSSRSVLVKLTELALSQLGHRYFNIVLPTPAPADGPIIRSTGASLALTGFSGVVDALCQADVVIDITVEGLMHAKETASVLGSGTRIMNISNEHPDILCRLLPDDAMMDQVKAAVKRIRQSKVMTVTSNAGTDLTVSMERARTVGVWGWTDKPGTLAHWPAGLVVSFPAAGSVNGQLILAPGDINLTFKRYLESRVLLTIENDFVTEINGDGVDASLMKNYLEAFNDNNAYATSHVGWGLNPRARYEALTMYDKNDTNGTELRALAGNFLYSTGANEFAGRFTRGHFDIPVMGCTISLDGSVVVNEGVPIP